jgi:hypothetical protein
MEAANQQQITLPLRSPRQRLLALAQQIKDTGNILLFLGNGYLFFGVIFGGLAIPGLVLYCLRWQLLRRTGRPAGSAWLWSLSLGHELFCTLLFYSDHPHVKQGENDSPLDHYEPLYLLGAAICLWGLLDLVWSWATSDCED